MRRQVGAHTVQIDTRKGWVRYTLSQPRVLDFSAIEKAIHGAGYTLSQLDLELEGVFEVGGGGAAAPRLRIPRTGQRFELSSAEGAWHDAGGVPLVPGEPARVRGAVSNWAQGEPRLTL